MSESFTSKHRLAVLAVSAAAIFVFVTLWWSWADKFAGFVMRLHADATVPFLIIALPNLLWLAAAFFGFQWRETKYKGPVKPRSYGAADTEARRETDANYDLALARHQRRVRSVKVTCVVLIAACVLSVYPTIRTMNRYGYEAQHALVSGNVVEVNEVQPGYEPRMAYPVAKALMERRLTTELNTADGSARINVSASEPTYLVVDGEEKWCSFLRPNAKQDRRPLNGVACLDSHGKMTRVEFKGNVPSDKARFERNLARAVSHIARGATFEDRDVYGYIDGKGEGHLVVPLVRPAGTLHSYDVPAGVVTFDQRGKGKLHTVVSKGEIPGPVVPISIAESLRNGLGARGTFRQFYQHRLELQDTVTKTSDAEGNSIDALDPNVGNASELHLRNAATGRLEFVTPLTPYGKSSNVVAVAAVPSDEVTAGQMPKLTLYRLPAADGDQPRLTNGDVLSRIVTRYSLAIPFADSNTDNSATQKFRVMEITPGTDPEVYVATLGLPNRPVYRVEMSRVDGASCVYSYESAAMLRCDAADVVTVPLGALTGTEINDPNPPVSETPNVPAAGSLTDVPLSELIAERNRVQAEIDRRAAG